MFTKELQKVYKSTKSKIEVEVNICKKLQKIYKSYKKFQKIKLKLKLMFPKDHNRFEADVYKMLKKFYQKLQQVFVWFFKAGNNSQLPLCNLVSVSY